MTNKQVVMEWLNYNTLSIGKATGSNPNKSLHYKDNVLYSYNTPIAVIRDYHCWLVSNRYSPTTTNHQRLVHNAIFDVYLIGVDTNHYNNGIPNMTLDTLVKRSISYYEAVNDKLEIEIDKARKSHTRLRYNNEYYRNNDILVSLYNYITIS